jgi:hypothetical protein
MKAAEFIESSIDRIAQLAIFQANIIELIELYYNSSYRQSYHNALFAQVMQNFIICDKAKKHDG